MKRNKRFISKMILSIFLICICFVAGTATVCAEHKTFYYWFNVSTYDLYSVDDADARTGDPLAHLERGGRGMFVAAPYGDGSVILDGNFAGYTPYWHVTANDIPGYTFSHYEEIASGISYCMYSYQAFGCNGRYIDSGMWYGQWRTPSWASGDSSWNNANLLRPNGSHSSIVARYKPNEYKYTTNGQRLTKVTYDAAIPSVSVPSKSNTVYFSAGTNHKGEPASISTKKISVDHTFGGYYKGDERHFNSKGEASHSIYKWPNDIDLTPSWKYKSIKLPTPTLKGYKFEGWYYDGKRVGGGGDLYTPKASTGLIFCFL